MQSEKHLLPNEISEDDKLIEVIDRQFENAWESISFTDDGIVIVFNERELKQHLSANLIVLSGIV